MLHHQQSSIKWKSVHCGARRGLKKNGHNAYFSDADKFSDYFSTFCRCSFAKYHTLHPIRQTLKYSLINESERTERKVGTGWRGGGAQREDSKRVNKFPYDEKYFYHFNSTTSEFCFCNRLNHQTIY